MKHIKVYPPNGGPGITPHPSKVSEMLAKGWKEAEPKPTKKPSKKVEDK